MQMQEAWNDVMFWPVFSESTVKGDSGDLPAQLQSHCWNAGTVDTCQSNNQQEEEKNPFHCWCIFLKHRLTGVSVRVHLWITPKLGCDPLCAM